MMYKKNILVEMILQRISELKDRMFDVYGVGNAIVDLLTFVDDIFIDEIAIPKGNMTLTTSKEQAELLNLIKDKTIHMKSGGSAANTMLAVANVGGKVFYTGKIAKDPYGEFYRKNLWEGGVDFNVHPLEESKGSTATCIVLITPDAERTMATHLGVSILLDTNDIQEDIIKKSKILYVEGYLWLNEKTRKAAIHAFELAKKYNVLTSFTFSDSLVVRNYRDDFKNIMKEYVDIVFLNSEETIEFCNCDDLLAGLNDLKPYSNLIFTTNGKNGCFVIYEGNVLEVPGFPEKAIDTTGAGDCFAGGVLFGISQAYDFNKSARLGNYLASRVVLVQGARLDKKYDEKIKEIIK